LKKAIANNLGIQLILPIQLAKVAKKQAASDFVLAKFQLKKYTPQDVLHINPIKEG
jgi:hypothetical protein